MARRGTNQGPVLDRFSFGSGSFLEASNFNSRRRGS